MGVFCITSIFSLIDSLKRKVEESTSFMVHPRDITLIHYPSFSSRENRGKKKWPKLTWQEYNYLAENMRNIENITLNVRSSSLILRNQHNSTEGKPLGVNRSYFDMFEIPIAEGRYFYSHEDLLGEPVLILGYQVAQDLFPDQDPLNRDLMLKGRPHKIIGVLEKHGMSFLSLDDRFLIPERSLSKLFHSDRQINRSIKVRANSGDEGLDDVESESRLLMRQIRNLYPVEPDNFSIYRSEFFKDILENMSNVLFLVGALLGGFSMLIGGFGVANIMFVSVQEQLFVIGLQKALGARRAFILFQFLFEAILICLGGSLLGLGLVYVGTLFEFYEGFELVLGSKTILLSMGFVLVMGICAGFPSAYQASRIPPIQALRKQSK
ncbi:MAG: ABC transporter permease [Cytophagales bacterium]|nr:ABC transporter permease [Cytophagales bacterium]